MKPEVIYEDNHLLVVNKPAGILSQSDSTGRPDLLSICKDYIKEKYKKPGEVYLGLVQRLDRDVSGVMVFARTSKAAARLSKQIRERETGKIYHAFVAGNPPPEGRLEGYLRKDEKALKAMPASAGEAGAQLAILTFRRMDTAQGAEQGVLLEVHLETGRFHQIRFQLSQAGFPIIGDEKYGGPPAKHIALRCVELSLVHPTTKETMTFRADGA